MKKKLYYLTVEAILSLWSCLLDVDKRRLAFAKEVGATHTLQIEKGEESENVAKKISDLLGDAPDRTIECSGAQFSVHLGVNVGRPS